MSVCELIILIIVNGMVATHFIPAIATFAIGVLPTHTHTHTFPPTNAHTPTFSYHIYSTVSGTHNAHTGSPNIAFQLTKFNQQISVDGVHRGGVVNGVKWNRLGKQRRHIKRNVNCNTNMFFIVFTCVTVSSRRMLWNSTQTYCHWNFIIYSAVLPLIRRKSASVQSFWRN